MTTITFDTRKAVRNLKAVGFEEPQADAIVDTLGDAFSDTVATRLDIAGLETRIADLKAEMFRALWIQGAGIVALTVGLTKWIP